MSDLVVVAAALCGVALVLIGLGWFSPRFRTRLAGERAGAAAGPLPALGLVFAGLVLVAVAIGVFSDDDASAAGDVEATCQLLAGINPGEQVNDELLDELDAIIDVAPDEIVAPVQTVRDAFAEQGEAAYDDPEVGTAIEKVNAFEGRACAD